MKHCAVISLFQPFFLVSCLFAQKIVFQDDFESYTEGTWDLTSNFDRHQNCQWSKIRYPDRPCGCSAQTKNSQEASSIVARRGTMSLRFERNNGDGYVKHSGCSARNEIVTPKLWNLGDDVWIGYSLYLCSTEKCGANSRWMNPEKSNKIIHVNQVTTGSPVWGMTVRWDEDGGDYRLHAKGKNSGKPLKWDAWNDIVVRMHWVGNGKTQVWQDGELVIDVGTGFKKAGYHKFKFGQYGNTARAGHPQICYFDEVKIALGANGRSLVDPAAGDHTPALKHGQTIQRNDGYSRGADPQAQYDITGRLMRGSRRAARTMLQILDVGPACRRLVPGVR